MVDPQITQLLADFVHTAREDGFNLNLTMPKFPELQNVDTQLLADFVHTAHEDGYDLNVTLPKFPEITGVQEEQTGIDPTVYYGTPVAELEKPEK